MLEEAEAQENEWQVGQHAKRNVKGSFRNSRQIKLCLLAKELISSCTSMQILNSKQSVKCIHACMAMWKRRKNIQEA